MDELERSDKETALTTLCVGAGMGTATIIETRLVFYIKTKFRTHRKTPQERLICLGKNMTLDVDSDGIALLTWDMPGRSMNVLGAGSMSDFAEVIQKVMTDDAIKGLVITSGKPAFIAGADLSEMEGSASGAGAPKSEEDRIRAQLRRRPEIQHVAAPA